MQYRGMDKAQLDAAYNNSQAVADFPALLTSFKSMSAEIWPAYAHRRNIRYAPQQDSARTRLDVLYGAGPGRKTLLFIHGGYWQACDKEDFAFIARPFLDRGINVILIEYTLAPQQTMTGIVGEIAQAISFIDANKAALNIEHSALYLAGHSAGGHLTSLFRSDRRIAKAIPISALVDLLPISLCWLNDKLRLTPQEIERFSPVRHIAPGVETLVCVGGGELPELVRHSKEYAQRLLQRGEKARFCAVADDNHFSLLTSLADADSDFFKTVYAFIND
ncbi:hypothetical protein C7M52_01488 [Mixta theicola]|nr:alpha/beta hydrolase [Mixta theicola]QHM75534.1 hypothetical protein C7M52_01488 [Mixta theicola]